MNRREFLQLSTLATAGYASSGFLPESNQYRTRVVIARNPKIFSANSTVDSVQLSNALDRAMQTLFNNDDPVFCWKKLVKPGEVIGIKVNCLSGRGTTNRALVDAVSERLMEAGTKSRDIIIWDRYNMDLEDAGYSIRTDGKGIQCFGNDHSGFEYELEVLGSAGSRVTKIMTQLCDGIINLPVLKDHSIAGVTIALKNMFGAIHNPNKYHLNVGDPYIADVNALPSVRNKIRLHICDAIEGQYQGGPSFMPQWRWPYGGLIVSRDPVALDMVGSQIIDAKRLEMGIRSLVQDNRQPNYIKTAADENHKLGICDLNRIKMIEI